MAEENNAVCAICGRGYHLCLSCKDKMALTPWKKHTDTSEHYKIYQILHGYSTGVYTKDEAREKFESVDLSDFDSLRENIKDIISDIRKVEEKIAEPAIEQPVVKQTVPVVREFDKSKNRKKKPFEVAGVSDTDEPVSE